MWPFDCELREITETKLRALIPKTREGQTLDYKMCIEDDDQDGWKLSILKDIASMANASGGYLVIGMAEDRDADDGTPGELVGITDGDNWAGRIKDVYLDSIAPRIVGLDINAVRHEDPGGSQRHTLVIHVPPSGNKPHMIAHRGRQLFYKRHGRTNKRMDIEEIRDAVIASNELRHRVAAFKDERRSEMERIADGDAPIFLFMYACPLMIGDERLDTSVQPIREFLNNVMNWASRVGQQVSAWAPVPTLGGVEQVSQTEAVGIQRNGFFDFASWMVGHRSNDAPIIFESHIVPLVYWWTAAAWEYSRRILDGEPLLLGVELCNALDTGIYRPMQRIRGRSARSNLIAPPAFRCAGRSAFFTATRHICDRIYNAYGLEKCPFINPDGQLATIGDGGQCDPHHPIPWPTNE